MADNDDKRAPGGNPGAGEEDLLSPFWAVLRGPRPGPEETPEDRAGRSHPGELVIATSMNRVLVRIQPDGTIAYGDGYTPDEAAVTLWEAIARRRPDFDARIRYLDLLELHVALIAVTDQAYEAAQAAARAEGATENDRFREEMSRRNWETRVHGIVEFAREYASMRPDLIAQARRLMPGGQGGPQGGQPA
jgi:hypothetical protein